MQAILKLFNDNHWYVIAALLACMLVFWIYGCQSEVTSMLDPAKRINRDELQLETDYVLGQAKVKLADLDRQDEIKKLVLDQAAIFGQTGTFNPTGLLNTMIAIGAIAFGLDRNKKLKDATKDTT